MLKKSGEANMAIRFAGEKQRFLTTTRAAVRTSGGHFVTRADNKLMFLKKKVVLLSKNRAGYELLKKAEYQKIRLFRLSRNSAF